MNKLFALAIIFVIITGLYFFIMPFLDEDINKELVNCENSSFEKESHSINITRYEGFCRYEEFYENGTILVCDIRNTSSISYDIEEERDKFVLKNLNKGLCHYVDAEGYRRIKEYDTEVQCENLGDSFIELRPYNCTFIQPETGNTLNSNLFVVNNSVVYLEEYDSEIHMYCNFSYQKSRKVGKIINNGWADFNQYFDDGDCHMVYEFIGWPKCSPLYPKLRDCTEFSCEYTNGRFVNLSDGKNGCRLKADLRRGISLNCLLDGEYDDYLDVHGGILEGLREGRCNISD